MPSRNRSRWWIALALVALLLPACLPLLTGHLPWRADGILHLYRQAHFERALATGDFYPRWLPDLAYGYGFPLFNYYAPLSYYLTLPFSLIGDTAFAMRMSYVAAMLLTGGSLYLWAMSMLDDARAAIVAAVAGVYAPYLLVNVHQRGALAEVWGVAFIALSLAGLDHLLRNPTRRNWLWVVFAVAGLLLVHNISALIAAPLLASYALVVGEGGKWRSRGVGWAVLAGLLGLGVAAFFWLPALLEQEYVQIERLIGTDAFQWQNHFLSLRELVSVPFSADSTQINPSIPIGFSIPALLLSAFSIVNGKWSIGNDQLRKQRHAVWLVIAFLLLTAMTLPISQTLWANLPLISFIQFPWRFLGPASLLLAMLAAKGAHSLLNNSQFTIHNSQFSSLLFPLLPLFFILLALPWLFPAQLQQRPDLTAAGSIRYEASSGFLGTTSAADYLPVAVKRLPPSDATLPLYAENTPYGVFTYLDPTSVPEDVRVGEVWFHDTPQSVAANKAWRVRYNQFYFPGWRVIVDGEAVEIDVTEPYGLISAEIPSDANYIKLKWVGTQLQRNASWLSIFATVSTLFLTIALPKTIQIVKRPQPVEPRFVAALATVGLLIAIFKQTYLNYNNTIFHWPRYEALNMDLPVKQVVHSDLVSINQSNINFGNVLRLVEFKLPQPVGLDEPIELDLYWTAQPPVAINPTVSIHLVDEQGRLFGQSDNYRPANFPISRWQAGEYALDTHNIKPYPYIPPGSYSLEIFVTSEEDSQRLDLLNANGQPLGTSYRLENVVTISRDGSYLDLDWQQLSNYYALSETVGVVIPPPPDTITVGETLPLLLSWDFTAHVTPTDARLQLRNADNAVVVEKRYRPITTQENLPDWQAGDHWLDPQTLPIPLQDLAGNPLVAGDYSLWLALDDVGEAVRFGDLKIDVPERTMTVPLFANTSEVSFGEAIQLVGYEVTNSAETITLDLAFRAEQIMPTAYTAFIHLLDINDQIIAQRDSIPVNGTRPTTGWLPPEIISETHSFPPPAAGTYRFAIGFYDATTGDRLGDRVILPQELIVEE